MLLLTMNFIKNHALTFRYGYVKNIPWRRTYASSYDFRNIISLETGCI